MVHCCAVMFMKNQIKGTVSLLGAVIIWGSTFVAQSVGMDHLGPFTFQAVCCFLAVLALLPLIWIVDHASGRKRNFVASWKNVKLWKSGILCGLALFAATSLQQIGLIDTDAGKAGFITAMYIVLVPILGLFLKKIPPKATIVSVIMAVIGLYLLSCVGVTEINKGDIYMMACAIAFAVQILLIDRYAADFDGLRLNCIQAMVCAVLSAVFMIATEAPNWNDILVCWFPLCYAGVLSMGIAYSLQIIGQKFIPSTTASLIMSAESVIAAVSGWIILKERMTPIEILGAILVFAAVILSQIPVEEKVSKA